MFLDDSACNLSSINLTKYLDDSGQFDIEGYRPTHPHPDPGAGDPGRLSSYPTASIAQNSHDYRPLGLGYANLGTLLMRLGIPYDSSEGRAYCGALTAIMCGEATGPAPRSRSPRDFPATPRTTTAMLRVMRKHRDAVKQIAGRAGYEDVRTARASRRSCSSAAQRSWDDAVELGEHHGYRNAQATVLAPTGTIGLLMDCDTTGIEPDFALVKFKKLAGGGYFKIVNQSVPGALTQLGYTDAQVHEIVATSPAPTPSPARRSLTPLPAEAASTAAEIEGREGAARRVQPRPGARPVGDRQGRLRAPRHQPAGVRSPASTC